jgi:hypothetical protein
MFPETSGRTLEELAFSMYILRQFYSSIHLTPSNPIVFEGKDIKKRQAKETEQELDQGHIGAPMKLNPPAAGDNATKPETEHVEKSQA